MKILILAENYYSGGVDTFIINLINHWPVNDDFVLLCNYDHPGLEVIQRRLKRKCQIVRHYCVTRPQIKRRYSFSPLILKDFIDLSMIYGQYLLFIFYIIYFYLLARKICPDKIIVCNGGYPAGDTCRALALSGLFSPKWGKPLLICHNTPMPARLSKVIPESLIDYFLKRSISFFVSVSRYTLRELANRPILRDFKGGRVIYYGIEMPDMEMSTPLTSCIPAYRHLPALEKGSSMLLMLATYEERKGHDFLLRSFLRVSEKIKNVYLVMAGFGYADDYKRINNLIKNYGLGHYAYLLDFSDDVVGLLRQAQILVMPSQRQESFGLTIVEAMSQGVPVVATDIGGIPEAIQDNQGGFVVPCNVDSFAEKIILLLDNESLRHRIGDDGLKAYRQRFLPERMCREYYGLLSA